MLSLPALSPHLIILPFPGFLHKNVEYETER